MASFWLSSGSYNRLERLQKFRYLKIIAEFVDYSAWLENAHRPLAFSV